MERISQPTKEQIRQWLAERRQSQAPLPDAEAIRRELGWRWTAAQANNQCNKQT